jgi:membrane associated rhomboid family serine protease
MNPQMLRVLSAIFFQAGIFSILLSVFIWWYLGSDEPEAQAHAERFGIFVGLWAPTLLILSNRFDRFADKATVVPALKPEHQEERGEG